jgi:hypothetical protein
MCSYRHILHLRAKRGPLPPLVVAIRTAVTLKYPAVSDGFLQRRWGSCSYRNSLVGGIWSFTSVFSVHLFGVAFGLELACLSGMARDLGIARNLPWTHQA